MVVVTCTPRRDGRLLLGPLHRRTCASFGEKRHVYTDEYVNTVEFPNPGVTVDVVHVLEKRWDAG